MWEVSIWYSFLFLYVVLMFVIILASVNMFASKDMPANLGTLSVGNLRTGDILLASGAWAVSALTNSLWSHTGIFWRDPKTKAGYVMELGAYHDAFGIMKIPIEKWVRYFKNRAIAVSQLETSNDEEYDPVKMDEVFSLYKNSLSQWSIAGMLKKPYITRFLANGEYTDDINGAYTCFELNISMLQHAGIYKKEYEPSSYYPWMLGLGAIPTEEGYKYCQLKYLDIKLEYKAHKTL